jgi:hypothetical protein
MALLEKTLQTVGEARITVGVNDDDIQAGYNNVSASQNAAGGFLSYPAGASLGSLKWYASNNAGNYALGFTNASFGQATNFVIHDPANANAVIVIGAGTAPFVSGNIPKASGTGGLMVDSGISAASIVGQIGQLYQASVTFNTAQMVTAYDTPLQIVANPLSSQVILLHFASVYTASTGNTPYATGTAPIIQYSTGGTNGAHGAGTLATASGLVAGDITASTSQVRNLYGLATAALTGLSGKGIYFSNATGDYTGGTGTNITFTVVYELLTATI